MTTNPHVKIDLSDVVKAGGVEMALLAWAKESDTTSAGTVGPEFSTSGPGSGWSKTHDAGDFASRAFEGGALYYLDETDGRLKGAVSADEGDEGAQRDIGGCWYTEGEWSDGSVVRLEVPDADDALKHPEHLAEMAAAVCEYHGAMSDRKGWAKLIREIQAAADALDEIDADELTD